MKEEKYTCDKCGEIIDGLTTPETGNFRIAGGGELCSLIYQGSMGHNQVPRDGWHYHYVCFCRIVDVIRDENNPK